MLINATAGYDDAMMRGCAMTGPTGTLPSDITWHLESFGIASWTI